MRLRRNALLAITFVIAIVTVGTWEVLRELDQRFRVDYTRRNMAFRPAHAGCYEITLGRWIPGWQPGHRIVDVAGRYQLDTAPGTLAMREDRRHYMEVGQPLIRPGWLPGSAYWIPVDSNSIQLIWSTGFNGIDAVLKRSASGYEGRAFSRTDVVTGAPQPRTSISATRISCTLVSPDTSRAPGRHARYMAESMRRYDSVRSLRQTRGR